MPTISLLPRASRHSRSRPPHERRRAGLAARTARSFDGPRFQIDILEMRLALGDEAISAPPSTKLSEERVRQRGSVEAHIEPFSTCPRARRHRLHAARDLAPRLGLRRSRGPRRAPPASHPVGSQHAMPKEVDRRRDCPPRPCCAAHKYGRPSPRSATRTRARSLRLGSRPVVGRRGLSRAVSRAALAIAIFCFMPLDNVPTRFLPSFPSPCRRYFSACAFATGSAARKRGKKTRLSHPTAS